MISTLSNCLVKGDENAQLASSHLYYIIFDEGLGAILLPDGMITLLTELPEILVNTNNLSLRGNILG